MDPGAAPPALVRSADRKTAAGGLFGRRSEKGVAVIEQAVLPFEPAAGQVQLVWERDGFWLLYKRLEAGTFAVLELPGASALINHLRELNVPCGIATSGSRTDSEEALRRLGLSDDVVVICKSDVKRAKPEPDLFLACRERLKPAE